MKRILGGRVHVPMLSPKLGNLAFQQELEEAALRVLRSGKYILGKEVNSFEEGFASYFGVKYAIGVSSGTDALIASLIALGVGPGDEVICPSFTFFATAGAVCRVGAKPVFVDILPECFTMAPEDLRTVITERTKAIIPVHLFGQSADIEAITAIAKEHNLFVVEDACQAIGAELDGQKVGTLGHTGCFSFFPSKNLGGFGDAGLVITNSDELAENLRFARNHGMTASYEHRFVGGNFRIDALQAALLRVKLKHLNEAEDCRFRNADVYIDRLGGAGVKLPLRARGKHVYNQFTVRVDSSKRDSLKDFLFRNNISSAVYYPLPLHQQPCFLTDMALPIYLRETEVACKEVLSLPIAPEVTREQVSFVANKILEFLS